LNATVTQQAAMIAYNDDFQMMLVLSLAAIPLVLLFRKGTRKSTEPVAVD
jgi:DHA2 family multidrug resistance protein